MWISTLFSLAIAVEPTPLPDVAPSEVLPVTTDIAPPPVAAPVEAPKPKKEPPIVGVAPGKGLTVTAADDRFSLTLRTRFVPRFDVHLPPPADGEPIKPETRAAIATARVWIHGHAFSPKLQYMLQLAVAARDFRDGAISPIFDAYIDYKPLRDLNIRVGQFFVPFDRLRTVREFALQMTDRPRPIGELTLDRDVGITLYSDHLGGDQSPVAYRLSVFGGGGIHQVGLRPAGALFVGRLELRPLGEIDDDSEGDLERRVKPGLALGVGAAYNLNAWKSKSTTGTTYVGGTTDYLHLAGDLVFKTHGFALQGEYLYKKASEEQILSTDADGAAVTEWGRSAQGWVAQGSYTFPHGIELVARGSQMYALGDTDPKLISELEARGNEVAAGFNWYRNGHRFKVQTTWVALFGDDFSKADHTIATQVDMTF